MQSNTATPRLPGYVIGPVSGVTKYYAVTTTPFAGVYTEWSTVSVLFKRFPDLGFEKFSTYSAARDAVEGARVTNDLIDLVSGMNLTDTPSPPPYTTPPSAPNSPPTQAPRSQPPSSPPAPSVPGAGSGAVYDVEFGGWTSVDDDGDKWGWEADAQTWSDIDRAEAVEAATRASAPVANLAPVIRPVRSARPPRGGWPIYAVLRGRQTGLFFSSTDCDQQVKGFPNGVGFGFRTIAEAEDWLAINGYTV
ncbi:hypothetical protein FA95DRAFT_1612872 [Auriscalpium vulgare]|uniref:Uncharacterized protein n=1 Tax=Auriscalpium vulgare TaxID=40419 RepID=A0ACB8R5H0_9AGAM|nr:hypothetical protein FA95DRAFT_1612872 [Auriscalpium vulgare]